MVNYFSLAHINSIFRANKSTIIDLFIILLLGTFSLTWFRGDFLISRGDLDFPLAFSTNAYFPYFYVWWDRFNLGMPLTRTLMQIPYMSIIAFLSVLGFSTVSMEKFIFYIWLTTSGLSMYYLVTTLVNGRGKRIAGLSAAVLYMTSPYAMVFIYSNLTVSAFFLYAFLPLMLALYAKGLNGKRGGGFYTSLIAISLITAPAFTNPAYVAIPFLILMLYFVFNIIQSRREQQEIAHKFKFTAIVVLIYLALNAWWLFPFIYYLPSEFMQASQKVIGISDLDVLKLSSSGSTVLNVLRLTGFWAFHASYKGDPYYHYAPIYSSNIFTLISFLIPLLAIASLLLKPKNKCTLYFGTLAILGLFLAKGLNPPLGNEFYKWLFSSIPIAGAFRNAYEKFGIIIALSYSFLIGTALNQLYSHVKEGRGIAYRVNIIKISEILAVICAIFLIAGVYSWPFWTGDIIPSGGKVIPSARVSVPNYYLDADNWLKHQNEDFRILPLPMSNLYGIAYSWDHGYVGPDPSIWLLSKPTISRFVDPSSGLLTYIGILQNVEPGFETGDTTGWSSQGSPGYSFEIQNTIVHNGKYAALVSLPQDGEASIFTAQSYSCQPGEQLKFSAFLKTDKGIIASRLMFYFYNETGKYIEAIGSQDYGGNYDWSETGFVVTVPENVSYFRPGILFISNKEYAGNGYVDDLSLPFYDLIQTGDLGKFLALMNIRYILLHNDVNLEYLSGVNPVIPPDMLRQILHLQKGIRLERSFGKIEFYRNDYFTPHIYATPSAILIHGGLTEMVHVIQKDEFVPTDSVLLLSNQNNVQQLLSIPAPIFEYKPINITRVAYNGWTNPVNWSSTFIDESLVARYYVGWKGVISTNGAGDPDMLVFPSLQECPYIFPPQSPDGLYAFNSTLVYLVTKDKPLVINSILTDGKVAEDIVGIWWENGWMGITTKPISFPITIPPYQRTIIQINHIISKITLLAEPQELRPEDSELTKAPTVTYEKINPTKYIVHVNASKPFFLVFSESYHKDWIAYVNGQQIPGTYHFMANGYANAWYINKTGTYTITLEFWPQRLFYIGSVISITTFILCVLYISKGKIKTIYKRYIRKSRAEKRQELFKNMKAREPLSKKLRERSRAGV